MSRPRKLPSLEDSIVLAEQTARGMWRAYRAYLSTPDEQRTKASERQTQDTLMRCIYCEELLLGLKLLRESKRLRREKRQLGK